MKNMGFLTNILSRTLFRSTFRDIDRLLEDVHAGKPIPKTEPNPKSGVLNIEGSTLSYASPDYGNWRIQVSEIIAFGEYTTDNGPMIDDWFMVFVNREFNWVEASNYCAGRGEVRNELAKRGSLESPYGQLWGRTTFASRVIWPQALAEKPLFEFEERSQTILEKVKSLGMGLIDKNLTPEVRQKLQSIPKS